MLKSEKDDSFRNINLRYRRALEAYFHRRVGNHAEAEDLAQEVFLRLIPKMRTSDVENKNAYIFKVATNLLRDRARRQKSHCESTHFSIDTLVDGEDGPRGPSERSLADERGPERIMLSRERLETLLLALDELGERTRSIFLMFRLENMKQKDIATTLGISVSAVEKHVVKALCHLSERL